MSVIHKFQVKIHELRGFDLAAKDRGGTSDPYLRINFDMFKRVKTSTKRKDLTPVWDEVIEFEYETRHIDKLSKKKLVIECFDKDKWGSDDLIGMCQVDLHTMATGPQRHVLPLRDGGTVAGKLSFAVQMEELASVVVNLQDVEISGLEGQDLNDVYLEYAYSGYDKFEQSTTKAPTGKSLYEYLDQLYVRATLRDLLAHGVHFWIRRKQRFETDDIIAEADLDFRNCYTFVDGDVQSFDIPLVGLSGTIAGSIFYKGFPQFCQMAGGYHDETGIYQARPAFDGVPQQPKVPLHGMGAPHPTQSQRAPQTESAPAMAAAPQQAMSYAAPPTRAAPVPQQTLQHKPPHTPVHATSHAPQGGGYPSGGGYGTGPSHGGGGGYADPSAYRSGGGHGFAQVGAVAQAANAFKGMGLNGASHSAPSYPPTHGYPGAVGSPAYPPAHAPSAYPPVSHGYPAATPPAPAAGSGAMAAALAAASFRSSVAPAAPVTAPSSGTGALAMALQGQGGADALPACWEKQVDSSGRVFYKNHILRSTAWELPTQSEYEITIYHPGPLGVELETNFSGRQRYAMPSGRRDSGADKGAVIKSIIPGGQFAQHSQVEVGHHLVALNGTSTLQWSFDTTLQKIMSTPRPMSMRFHNPYAVPTAAARPSGPTPFVPGGHPSTPHGPPTPHGPGPDMSGWTAMRDPASGRQYYSHQATGRTSWNWPPQ